SVFAQDEVNSCQQSAPDGIHQKAVTVRNVNQVQRIGGHQTRPDGYLLDAGWKKQNPQNVRKGARKNQHRQRYPRRESLARKTYSEMSDEHNFIGIGVSP